MPPLAPGPHEVEQAVEQPPHVRRPRSTARLRRRDERFDQVVLGVAQGLATPQVSDQGAFLGRPHRRSPSKGLLPNGHRAEPSPPLDRGYRPFQTGC